MAECYTEMSEESDIEASDSEEIEICNRINLKPYDMDLGGNVNMGKLNLWHLAFFPSLLSENERVLFNTNMSLWSFHLQRIKFINIKLHNSKIYNDCK